jgi:hypothetical protein
VPGFQHLKSDIQFYSKKNGITMKNSILSIIFILFASLVNAQQTAEASPMAFDMRSNGKIYVVVAVLLTIMIGLILYIISVDKKISKLEKE